MLKKFVVFLILVLWPLNLILKHDFPSHNLPQTIFVRDYEAEQLILRNIYLYPNAPFARTYQNKGKVYFNKFVDNFFALTDPNNYFFALHPRPIVSGNKNLFKYPFLAIVFFIYGIFNFEKFKYRKITIMFSAVTILLLSILQSFDGYDFILWIPISAITIYGIGIMSKNKKLFNYFSLMFILFTIPEILRSFIK